MNRRVAAYLRYSSANQRATSLDDQLRNIRALVEREGDELPDEFIFQDAAVSGATEAGREGLLALKEALFHRPPPVEALVVDDSSRLGRNMAETLLFQEDLDFYNIELVTVDGMRSSMPGSELGFKVRSILDDVYIQDLRHKTLRGLEGQVHRGLSAGGRVFGYRSVPVPDPTGRTDASGDPLIIGMKRVVHEPEAAVVRRAFELRLEGRSVSDIVDALAKENAPAPNPGRRKDRKRGWNVSSLSYILKNPIYRGDLLYKREKFVKNRQTGKRLSRKRPASDLVFEPRPDLAIVPRDVFDRVQALAAERASKLKRGPGGRYKGSNPGRTYSPYLLSGLLKCGICGSAMVVMGGKRNENTGKSYRGYQCPSRKRRGTSTCTNVTTISQSKIETAVVRELQKKLFTPKNVDFYMSQFRKAFEAARQDKGFATRTKVLEDDLAKNRTAIENLLAFLKSGGVSEEVSRELPKAEARQRELEADLAAMAGKWRRVDPPPTSAIRDGLLRLQATLYLDPKAAQVLLKAVVGELKLTPRMPGEAAGAQKEESRTPLYEVSGSAFLPNLLLLPNAGGPSVVAGPGFEPGTYGL